MTKARVLIIDDDPAFRDFVGTVLRDEGNETTEIGTGDEAIRWLSESPLLPNLIILDMDLGDPKWNGLQICHWLKERPRLRKIPVIIATGMPGQDHRMEAHAVHSNFFLNKPFSRQTLTAAVTKLLSVQAAQPSPREKNANK